MCNSCNSLLPYFTKMDNDTIDIVVGKLKKPERKSNSPLKIKRSTYTETSAETIKPILDKLLAEPKDVFVPSLGTGYTVGTLSVKINDGLLWFIENLDEPEEYAFLRTQISTRIIQDDENPGVLVYFKRGMRKIRRKNHEGKALEFHTTDSSLWRHNVVRWLESATEGKMFESGNIEEPLTDDDERWLRDTLATMAPDAEMLFKDNSFRIIR